MILNKQGEVFEYNGQKYEIGQTIVGLEEPQYFGLRGRIFEIRTGSDRETENDTPDIYCEFDPPTDPKEVAELEEIFSELYCEPKRIDDITLDYVILSPDDVAPYDLKTVIEGNMSHYRKSLVWLSCNELIDRAQEIAATQVAYEELTKNAQFHPQMKMLEGKMNPLAFARNALLEDMDGRYYLPSFDAVLQVHQTALDMEVENRAVEETNARMDKAREIADALVKDGCEETANGTWGATFEELEQRYQVRLSYNGEMANLILDQLSESDEVNDVEMTEVGFEMELDLRCCVNLSDDMLEKLQEELDRNAYPTLT